MNDEYPISCECCGEQIDNFDDDFNGMCKLCYDTPPANLEWVKKQFEKCDKCDDRGHITDTPFPEYSGHSCDCEWAEEKMRRLGMPNEGELDNLKK